MNAERAAGAFAATRAGVLLLGADDRIIAANGGAATILCGEVDDLVGSQLHEILPAMSLTGTDPAGSDEQLAMCHDSSFKMVSCYVDSVDEGVRVVVFVDLTQSKANERDLLLHTQVLENASHALFDAKHEAEEKCRRKSEFLARVSHEIRTPMTAILGFAEELARPELAKSEQVEASAIIRRNVEHLMTVLNDILDLAKVEADRMEVRRAPLDPMELSREVLELFRTAARHAGTTLRLEPDGPIPHCISTDPTRLRQILINLTSNAIKCGASCVRLGVRVIGPPNAALLEFTVTDDGPGMTPVQLNALFQPFSPGASGAGLGLSISRRLATLLGGDLTAVSEVGAGSTFRLHIAPGTLAGCDDVAGAQIDGATSERLGARILVVDDGVDNQRLLGSILRRAGAEVEIVGDGADAVAAARAAQDAGQAFDLILMDMQMPGQDGFSATRELRGGGYSGRILALTANALAGSRERCLEAGCDGYASKPIDREQLLATIHRTMR